MEKAIEIKRRAQRCIQNGDLDGALAEYEKLVQAEDSDPYNFVLLADLLFKRGDGDNAVQRYLAAVAAYEKASLFKNAIAVCKKMMRLSLAPSKVLERLASLHAADGLGAEAALYYMQYAETLVRADEPVKAAEALRKAFEASPEEVKALERMSEAYALAGDTAQAASAMGEAAYAYAKLGRLDGAAKCRQRAEQIQPGSFATLEARQGPLPGVERPASADAPPVAVATPDPSEPDAAPPALESSAAMAPHANWDAEDRAHAGPPRLPVADETPGSNGDAASLSESTAGPSENGAHAHDAEAHGIEFERFPSAFANGSRPGMSFDAPAMETADTDGASAEAARDDADAASGIEASAPAEMGDEVETADDQVTAGAAMAEERGSGPESEQVEDASEVPETDAAVAEPVAAEEPPSQESFAADEADARPEAEEPATASTPPEPAAEPRPTVADIERLLSRAQEHFRAGDREAASNLLVDAALAYERIDRLDNAASIFRSLARGPHATPRLLGLWLDNAQRRGDRAEAAEVACELGDRAVNDSELEAAQEWFQRACDYDPENAVARRRLSRLAQLSADAAGEPAPVAAAPRVPETEPVADALAAEGEHGRVEMALGRAEAVTFDLGSLLAEFQRGIEAQLSGDAQSHYDLAMTYREMGLLEQALDSFRLAARDPVFAFRAAEMVGRCLMEQGRFGDAANELAEALRSPSVPAEAALGLRYQLGLAHEAAGDPRAALGEFERVFAVQANYSDVALKIRVLRESLESA